MGPSSRYTAIILLPLLSFGCVSSSTYQKKVDEATALGQSVDELRRQQTELQTRLDQCKTSRDESSRQLTSCQKDLADRKQSLDRAQGDIARLEQVLTDRNQEAGKALSEMRETISRQSTELGQLQQQLDAEKAVRTAQVAEMEATYGQLLDNLRTEVERGEVTLSALQGRLTVSLAESLVFDSGNAELKNSGTGVLRKVGKVLAQLSDKEIRIEGHTDNVPISPKLQPIYPSNWELSAARATNVLQFLHTAVGIPGERLIACGFGEFRPLADNATAAGRTQNRRIQIVLVPLDSKSTTAN